MRAYKLGSEVTDKYTAQKGMLTHLAIRPGGLSLYWFKLKGLNNDTGEPLGGTWITPDRVIGGEEVDCELPIECIGTQLDHKFSGFKGFVTEIQLHINGCVHAYLQPTGTKKCGETFDSHDFSILELSGNSLKKLTEKQKDVEKKERPSPSPVGRSH